MKEKQIIHKVYVTPKKFAECIDSIFSNHHTDIADFHHAPIREREAITVDMLLDWLIQKGTSYADFIGFFDSYFAEVETNITKTKVYVSNITKDINTDMGYGVFLHHVVCDCTIENGETEKQAYRIFSKKEYEDVMTKGYYEIVVEDDNAVIN